VEVVVAVGVVVAVAVAATLVVAVTVAVTVAVWLTVVVFVSPPESFAPSGAVPSPLSPAHPTNIAPSSPTKPTNQPLLAFVRVAMASSTRSVFACRVPADADAIPRG
jgi:hypothetical protein